MQFTSSPSVDTGLSRVRSPAHTVLALHGELDMATTPALREQLLTALRRETPPLIIDLSRVSFCDAAGLSLLIGVQRRARLSSIVLSFAAPQPHVARLLLITGLDRGLSVHPTLPLALWAHRPGSGPEIVR
jgi:anti-sigma B factor antagonist